MIADSKTEQAQSAAPVFAGHRVRVLLVDDQLIIAEAIRRALHDTQDTEFLWARDAQAAIQHAVGWKPTVILQDLVMPDADGFALLQQYRAHPDVQNTPIIVLSSKEDPELKAQGFAMGANDYMVKPPNRIELLARIRYHSAAYINRLERDAAFLALRESERKLAEANIQLQRLAEVDGLTGVGNRRRFDEVLQTEWLRASRTKTALSLLLCDVDFFKKYNDTHGHVAGDECLKRVASALGRQLKRPADFVARYGGEEFALVLPETGKDGAVAVAEACRSHIESLAIPNQQEPNARVVTLSIGVATMVPMQDDEPTDLIRNADLALYEAKRLGRNRVVPHS